MSDQAELTRTFTATGLVLVVLFASGLLLRDADAVEEMPPRPVTDTGGTAADSSPDSVEPGELAARIERADGQIVVWNRDMVSWSRCRVSLNAEILEDGHYLDIERIVPNDSIHADIRTFATSSGERFNPETHVIRAVRVRCRLPGGPGTFVQPIPPRPPPAQEPS